MKLVLEDFMTQMKELKNQMVSMQPKQSNPGNQLLEERKLYKLVERNAKALRKKLDYARQEKFNDRLQHVMNKDQSGKSALLNGTVRMNRTDMTVQTIHSVQIL